MICRKGAMKSVISNDEIKVTINSFGAELCSFFSEKRQKEYLWQADPEIWSRSAPILFPVVGRLKEDQYRYDGRTYTMSRHGFAKDREHKIIDKSKNKIKYMLESDEDTLKQYPFRFYLLTEYSLSGSRLETVFQVINRDNKRMYFSIGAHPAFFCRQGIEEQVLEFHNKTSLACFGKNEAGLFEHHKTTQLINDCRLKLRYSIFQSALFYENESYECVVLKNEVSNESVRMSYSGFPYTGLWTLEGAPFLCIEPCYGLGDFADTTGELKEKMGIQVLQPGETFSCRFRIEVCP